MKLPSYPRLTSIYPALLGLTLAAIPAAAEIIGDEPFAYPDGPVVGLDGGTGWSYLRTAEPNAEPQAPSTWDDVTAGPEVFDGTLLTSGNSAKREFGGPTEGSGAGSNEREGAFRAEGVVFFAVDYMLDVLLDEGTNQWSGFSSYDFGTERIFFGLPTQNTALRYFGLAGTALGGTTLSPIPVEAGVTYRLIGAVDFDADLVKLWVNPDANDFDNGVTHSADVAVAYTGTNWSSAVRLGSGAGFTTTWDNLQVADSLTDLLPAPSGVIVTGVSLNALEFRAEFTDAGGAQFDPARPVTVTVDGAPLAVAVNKTGGVTVLSFSQSVAAVFENGPRQVVIAARDTANQLITFEGPITTRSYTPLEAAWQAPTGEVATGSRGFRATLHQLGFARYPGDATNVLPQPERQLAQAYADRRTGQVAANLIEPGSETGGVYLVTEGLDWDIGGGHGEFPGQPIPGVPGLTGSTNHIVAEVFAWLDLPAGLTRFGVTSDDGFLVSAGATPLDFTQRVTLGVFDGGRGAEGDTLFDVVVPTAGLYPVRLLWWQGTGDASVEFFSLKADGTKVLVDDPADPEAIKAYPTGRAAVPSLHALAPYPNSQENGALQPIRIEIIDGVAGLDDASVSLSVDGAAVTPQLTRPSPQVVVITFAPPGGAWPFLSSHTVELTYRDTLGASRTETWTFAVGSDPAEIIGTEPFEYPDGPIAGLDGGTGWSYLRTAEPNAEPQAPSTWDDVTAAPEVLDGVLLTSGNSAKREFGGPTEGVDAGSNEREGAFRAGGVVYFAVDYRLDVLLDEGTNQWSGFSSYDFGTERIFFGIPGQSTGERFFGVTGTALGTTALTPIPVEAGVTYRLVGAVDFDADLVKLWVDPDGEDYDHGADHTADAAVAYTGTNWSSAVRLGSGAGFTTTWDNLVVAQRLADAVAATPAATLPLLDFQIDRAAGTLDLTWGSTAGQTFDVEYSRALGEWQPLATDVPAGAGDRTTYHGTAAGNPQFPNLATEERLFFRVRESSR